MFLDADAVHAARQEARGNGDLKRVGGCLGGAHGCVRVRRVSNVSIGHTFRVDDLAIDSQDDAVIRANLHGQRGVRADRSQVDVACEVVRDRTVLLRNVEGGRRAVVSPADRAGAAVVAQSEDGSFVEVQ